MVCGVAGRDSGSGVWGGGQNCGRQAVSVCGSVKRGCEERPPPPLFFVRIFIAPHMTPQVPTYVSYCHRRIAPHLTQTLT